MATGTPKTRSSVTTTSDSEETVRLDYPDKAEEAEILATPPSRLRLLWPRVESTAFNRLIFGDNLGVLSALMRDSSVRGKIRLVYIDPPFATRMTYHSRGLSEAYDDMLQGARYIEFLRKRLLLLRELLASDGSIYVHLDDNMVFHAKILLDEIFGAANFRNCIVRKKCNPKNYTRKNFGNVSDYILFYSKGEKYVWNRPVEEWTPERIAKEYQYRDEVTGRLYKKVPVHAPGVRNGDSGKEWRGMLPPPGKHWQFTPKTLDDLDKNGEIYWSPNGNPRRKVYLDESEGIPVQDIWLDCKDAHNQNIYITGYPTEKNPLLISRIIAASSGPGDIVLDSFCGSGTTLEAASLLGRRWIGIDNSPEAISTTLNRFSKGTAPMGDFVKGKRNEDDAATLPMFGEDPDAERGTDRPTSLVISDFQFFSDDGPTPTLVERAVAQFDRERTETLI